MKRVTKRLREPFNGEGGGNKSVSAFKASAAAFAGWEAQSEGGKRGSTVFSLLQCSVEEWRAKAETGLLWPLLLAAQRGKAGVLGRRQSSPTCRSYKTHSAASSLCPHLLITCRQWGPVTDSAHFNRLQHPRNPTWHNTAALRHNSAFVFANCKFALESCLPFE